MKNKVLKTCLTALVLSAASLANAVIVPVDSKNQAFQSTGIIVTAGDTINISTPGVITWGCTACKVDANGIVPSNGQPMSSEPSGADFLVQGTRIFSLVGRIGASTLVPEGAPALGAGFVGASYSQTANASGELFLAFNDDAYSDNIGTWQANITTITAVEISPFKSHAAISGGAINIAASSTVNGDLAAQAAVVIGANTVVNHEIYAGAAVTTGALSTVENIFTGAATGIGAGATAGEIYAGAATVVGAGGKVGNIHAGAAITLGAGATAGSQDAATASAGSDGSIQILSDMDTIMGLIGNTQSELGSLVPTVVLPMATTMGGYIPLEPGVHHGDAVSIAASSTVAFDATHAHVSGDENQVWVINLSEALTVGAGTNFEVTGLKVGHTATIIWNIGAALNLGAGTSFRGTAFVDGAVNAATSSVSCGHLYATGAISIGSIGVDSLGDPAICENADAVFTYLETLH
jgi:hypothetical protein